MWEQLIFFFIGVRDVVPTAGRFFPRVKFEANATNVKSAAPRGERNCFANRTFFVLATSAPHERKLNNRISGLLREKFFIKKLERKT